MNRIGRQRGDTKIGFNISFEIKTKIDTNSYKKLNWKTSNSFIIPGLKVKSIFWSESTNLLLYAFKDSQSKNSFVLCYNRRVIWSFLRWDIPATSVATRMGYSPLLNSLRTLFRSNWSKSPWINPTKR